MKQKPNKTKLDLLPVCDTHLPVLHESLKQYLGYCFYKAALGIRARVNERLAPFGLVAQQFGMLIILNNLGSKTQAELCQDTAIDKATMVRMLDGLEEKKYVTRVPSTEDRRVNRLEVTKAGKLAIEKMDLVRKKAEEEFLAPLNATERTQLRGIIAKLIGVRADADSE